MNTSSVVCGTAENDGTKKKAYAPRRLYVFGTEKEKEKKILFPF